MVLSTIFSFKIIFIDHYCLSASRRRPLVQPVLACPFPSLHAHLHSVIYKVSSFIYGTEMKACQAFFALSAIVSSIFSLVQFIMFSTPDW